MSVIKQKKWESNYVGKVVVFGFLVASVAGLFDVWF